MGRWEPDARERLVRAALDLFSEQAVLAKEGEAELLYRDMQTDLVQQIMRRLAAVKPQAAQ